MERVIEQELHQNAAVITKVSETASKEFAIESALDKMQGAWAAVKLNTEEYRETGPLHSIELNCWSIAHFLVRPRPLMVCATGSQF